MKELARLVLVVGAVLAPVESLDLRLERMVQGARQPALEGPMRWLTAAGRPVVVGGGLVVIALLDRAQGPATAVAAVVALVPANLTVEGLKRVVNRTRPDGERRRSNASFPSSHAANACALAYVLARRWRRLGPGVWVVGAAIAFSRVYLNRHYPSDVLAGAAIGVLWGWAGVRLQARLALKAARKTESA